MLPRSLLLVFVAACANTDPAVFVEANVSSPKATVASAALGTSLSGSFTMALHLGARASGSSEVTAESFAITNADQTEDVVALDVTAEPDFPLTVAPDSTVTVALSFTTGKDPLAADKKTALCASSGIRIKAIIKDSLNSSATPAASPVFNPTGCE